MNFQASGLIKSTISIFLLISNQRFQNNMLPCSAFKCLISPRFQNFALIHPVCIAICKRLNERVRYRKWIGADCPKAQPKPPAQHALGQTEASKRKCFPLRVRVKLELGEPQRNLPSLKHCLCLDLELNLALCATMQVPRKEGENWCVRMNVIRESFLVYFKLSLLCYCAAVLSPVLALPCLPVFM